MLNVVFVMMDKLNREMKILRERQDTDFDTIMLAFSVQRDAQKKLERAFRSYRRHSNAALDVLHGGLVELETVIGDRFENLEARVARLEDGESKAS